MLIKRSRPNSVHVDDEAVLRVLEALREGGPSGATKASLRKALSALTVTAGDCSSKALDKKVERCLRSLAEDGAKIERERNEGSAAVRFTLKKGPAWDEHITGEARLALKLAGLTLSQAGTRLWHDKLQVIEEIASGRMSSKDRGLFQQLERVVKVYGGVEDPVLASPEDILEPILEALAKDRLIRIDYLSAGAKTSKTMELVPHALSHDLFSGGAYLMAWNPRRQMPILLRLNRVVSVKVLRQRGVITHPDRLQRAMDYQIGGWASDEEPFEIQIRVWGASWICSILEAPPALKDFEALLEDGGNSLLIRFKANREEGPMRWVLQFGSCAEILEPAHLRQRLREELEESLKAYVHAGPAQP